MKKKSLGFIIFSILFLYCFNFDWESGNFQEKFERKLGKVRLAQTPWILTSFGKKEKLARELPFFKKKTIQTPDVYFTLKKDT